MMTSSTTQRSLATFHGYCWILIFLIYLTLSESTFVNKEDLTEEHLLPVAMARAAAATDSSFEGSGDDSPIFPLRSHHMERMTLKTDGENKPDSKETKDEAHSRETIEDDDEGSGSDDERPRTAELALAKDEVNDTAENSVISTKSDSKSGEDLDLTKIKEFTTVLPEAVTVTEISLNTSTIKEFTMHIPTSAVTEATTSITEADLAISAYNEPSTVQSETDAEIEVSLEISAGMEETSSLPVDVHATEISNEEQPKTEISTIKNTETTIKVNAEDEPEVTTVEEGTVVPIIGPREANTESEPVGETVVVKHVKPSFAVEVPLSTVILESTEVTAMPETPKVEVSVVPEVPIVTTAPEAPEVPIVPETTVVAEAQETTKVQDVSVIVNVPEIEKAPEEKEKTEGLEIVEVTTKLATVIVTSTDNGTVREENLTLGMNASRMNLNSRLLDSDETVVLETKDSSRLGAYIVISLILLSFLSLAGFILMKRRKQKRRKQANLDQENLDTEKALLSLSEYKDHPDGLDEGKIKNNEITPLVIKSNSQINKFEKNTNFSSPKNLNTKANEKNVEKDNVLRKTSENLTQVIIEDPSKDVEEEKTPANAEKLIVRTHLDQDSIPKKPVFVSRTSLGCVPVSQD